MWNINGKNPGSGWSVAGPPPPGGTAPDPGKGSAHAPPRAPGAPPPTGEGMFSGPGYQEDFYKQHGQDLMGTPSASEDLYSRGVAASNPFYDYAQTQTTKAINDAAAARGNFNSSYTMRNIGNAVADLRGQQAHELGQLAGQADQGKFGRYDRSNEYAGDAQRAMENRGKTAAGGYSDLAGKQAGLVDNFYKTAGEGMDKTGMAAIELKLKEAGLTSEEIGDFLKGISTIGSDVIKVAA